LRVFEDLVAQGKEVIGELVDVVVVDMTRRRRSVVIRPRTITKASL
jgi:hypothetical protein